ncbi:type II secretion system protein J [Acidobacteriota bacterium]
MNHKSNTLNISNDGVKKRSHMKGLSLIEVLIGMVLMSIAMLALLSLYNSGQKYFTNQDAHSDILTDSRVTLTLLSQDIKEAIQVIPGPIDVGGTTYSTSVSCIVLKVPSVDTNGLIIDIDNHFDYLVYRVNPDNAKELLRIVEGKDGISSRVDGNKLLTRNIDSLVMSFLDTDGGTVSNYAESAIIDIALTTLKKGIQRTYQETINTQTKLRNKAVT